MTTTHHNLSMATDSPSPIISADDEENYQFSSPVNEADEIILRGCYTVDGPVAEGDHEGTSLWHDLDRDGINIPAIPSFILNSPPMGPMRIGSEYNRGHSDVTIHSLRKGCPM